MGVIKIWLIFGNDSSAISPKTFILIGTSLTHSKIRFSDLRIAFMKGKSFVNAADEKIWAIPNNSGYLICNSFLTCF